MALELEEDQVEIQEEESLVLLHSFFEANL